MGNNNKNAKKKSAKKTNKKAIWLTLGIIALVAIIAVSIFTSQAFQRTKVAMTVGDEKIREAEYAYFYQSAYQSAYDSLAQTYGENMVSYVLDSTKPLNQQTYTDGVSWHDYLNETARSSIEEIHTLTQAAKENGYELSDLNKSNIDIAWDALEQTAAQAGYSTKLYMRSIFGHGMNEKIYRGIISNIMLADEYSGEVRKTFTYDDDYINKYYEDHKIDFDTVDLRMISIDFTDDGRNDPDTTDSYGTAQYIIENVTCEEDFAKAAYMIYDDDSVETEDDSLYHYVPASELTMPGMAEWFFDESRQYGDMEIFTDDEYAYYVGYFIARHDVDYNTVDMRHILITPEDEDGDGTFTQEATADAYDLLGQIMDIWDASDKTEETFAEMATEYTMDTASQAAGGLYTNVYKGEMVSAINDWLYDEARVPGDYTAVETSYGFHLVYFVGENDNSYKTIAVTTGLQESDYNSWFTTFSSNVDVQYAPGLDSLML